MSLWQNMWKGSTLGNITTNTTYQIKSSGGDFTDLQSAFNFLKNYRINKDVFVTLQMANEIFTVTTRMDLNHPDGSQIYIKGDSVTAETTTTITGINSVVSVGTGNHTVLLDVVDSTGILVNDYIYIYDSTGTGSWTGIEGVWKVTGVPGSTQIQILHKARNATWPTMTVTGGTITKAKTMIVGSGIGGAVMLLGSIGAFQDILIVGNGASTGINMAYSGTTCYFADVTGTTKFGITDCSTYGLFVGSKACHAYVNTSRFVISGVMTEGISVYNGSTLTIAGNVIIIGVAYAISASQNSTVRVTSSQRVILSCGGFGYLIAEQSLLEVLTSGAKGSWIQANTNCGIYTDYNSEVFLSGSVITHINNNGNWGLVSTNRSSISIQSSGVNLDCSGNTTNDFRAVNGSTIWMVSSPLGTPVYESIVNQVNTTNGLILIGSGPTTFKYWYDHTTNTSNPHAVTAAQVSAPVADGLAKITVGAVAPVSPGVGDVWVDTANGTTIYTSGPQTLDATMKDIVCNSGAGFTVNLPVASSALVGQVYNVKNIGAGNISLSGNGTNIDSATPATIVQWANLTVKLVDITGSGSYLWVIL